MSLNSKTFVASMAVAAGLAFAATAYSQTTTQAPAQAPPRAGLNLTDAGTCEKESARVSPDPRIAHPQVTAASTRAVA